MERRVRIERWNALWVGDDGEDVFFFEDEVGSAIVLDFDAAILGEIDFVARLHLVLPFLGHGHNFATKLALLGCIGNDDARCCFFLSWIWQDYNLVLNWSYHDLVLLGLFTLKEMEGARTGTFILWLNNKIAKTLQRELFDSHTSFRLW